MKVQVIGAPRARFSQIEDIVTRNPDVDVYDFRVFCAIKTCGVKAFPGYDAFQRWTGISRERISKSIRRLEAMGLITRYAGKGRSIHYKTYCTSAEGLPPWAKLVRFDDEPKKSVVRRANSGQLNLFRGANDYSSPGELESVRGANSIEILERDLIKSADSTSKSGFELFRAFAARLKGGSRLARGGSP